ncbi:MAG TPA: hypothetical protein VFP40_19815 [Terriglobales bacterium]|nr:hypothetical protein [Terriglobales bacterium]
MKRLLIISLLIASTFAFNAAPASAAATCTIHNGALYKWSEQTDWVGYNADFKCGGAANTRFRVKVTLQVNFGTDQNPSWLEGQCDAGPCQTTKPSSSTWFPAGVEQAWGDGKFNYAGQIDGWQMRMRYDVIFENGDPNPGPWFSSKVTV